MSNFDDARKRLEDHHTRSADGGCSYCSDVVAGVGRGKPCPELLLLTEVDRLRAELAAAKRDPVDLPCGHTGCPKCSECLVCRAEKAEAKLVAAHAAADRANARYEGGDLAKRIGHLGYARSAWQKQAEKVEKVLWRAEQAIENEYGCSCKPVEVGQGDCPRCGNAWKANDCLLCEIRQVLRPPVSDPTPEQEQAPSDGTVGVPAAGSGQPGRWHGPSCADECQHQRKP